MDVEVGQAGSDGGDELGGGVDGGVDDTARDGTREGDEDRTVGGTVEKRIEQVVSPLVFWSKGSDLSIGDSRVGRSVNVRGGDVGNRGLDKHGKLLGDGVVPGETVPDVLGLNRRHFSLASQDTGESVGESGAGGVERVLGEELAADLAVGVCGGVDVDVGVSTRNC